MTVKELIEVLQSHNPSDMVIVAGYGVGYNEIEDVDVITIALDVYADKLYCGNHEIINAYDMTWVDPSKYTCKTAVRVR